MTVAERLNRDHPSTPVSDRYRERPMTSQDVFRVATRDALAGALVRYETARWRRGTTVKIADAWLKVEGPQFAFDRELRLYWPVDEARAEVHFEGGGRSVPLRPDGSTLLQHWGLSDEPIPDPYRAQREADNRAWAPPTYPS